MVGAVREFVRVVAFEFHKRVVGFNVPQYPLMDKEGGEFFEECLRGAQRYLEYGSGGSTILAARLGKSGVTIEGDRFCLRDVRRTIGRGPHGMALTHIDIGPTKEWGYPRFDEPTEKNVAAWRRYVLEPFERPDERFFDLVLVDGRLRVACALASIMEAAKRRASFRLLLDDYDERAHYHVVEGFVPLARTVGRMAVFEVSSETIKRVPSEADLDRFVRDLR